MSPGDPVMLIVCPNCVSSYSVNPDILRHSQGAVRCAHCRRAWTLARDGHEEWGFEGEAALPETKVRRGSLLAGARQSSARGAPTQPALISSTPGASRASPVRVVASALLLLALLTGAIGGRRPILHAAPALAPLYAMAGLSTGDRTLTLEDVKTVMIREGTTPVLTLEGRIENGRHEVARVPNIRIVVRDEAEQSLYTWTAPAPKASLRPGETVTFKSRLVAPPGNGHDLQVGFTDAHAVLADAVTKDMR